MSKIKKKENLQARLEKAGLQERGKKKHGEETED